MGKGSQFQAPTALTTEKDPPVNTEYEAGRTHSRVRAGNPTMVPQLLQPVTKSLKLCPGIKKGTNCISMAGYLEGQMVGLQSGR